MTWRLDIENVAGIHEGRAVLEPGVNAVQGSNWQGKTSLLAAVKTALGTAATLTEGESSGRVELETDDGTFVTELTRDGDAVVRRGDAVLRDEYERVCATHFAFLDAENPVRAAVRSGEPLEPVLTAPLDFEDVDEAIAETRAELEQVEREYGRAEEAAADLPAAERRVADLEARLEDLTDRRDALRGGTADGDDRRAELSSLRAERDQAADRVERLEETVERTAERLAETRAELEALDAPAEADVVETLAEVRDDLRERERDLELLQSVYEANRRVLDEERTDLLTDVERGLVEDAVTCWVCGTEASRESFETRLDDLRDRIERLDERVDEKRARVEELTERRDRVQERRRERSDLESAVADLERTLADREESLETARRRLAELDRQATDLEREVEGADETLTDVESEIKYVRAELEDARDEQERLESAAAQRDVLASERTELQSELERLRTRKERLKQRTREAFDAAIRDAVARFETSFETARLTSTFDLVVARDGREVSLDALSEGEVELLGLVAAIAGHEAFDVGEAVPALLVDGIGALAAENVYTLVSFLDGRADYLLVTAYPEHAGFDGNELDPADWSVVSDAAGPASL